MKLCMVKLLPQLRSVEMLYSLAELCCAIQSPRPWAPAATSQCICLSKLPGERVISGHVGFASVQSFTVLQRDDSFLSEISMLEKMFISNANTAVSYAPCPQQNFSSEVQHMSDLLKIKLYMSLNFVFAQRRLVRTHMPDGHKEELSNLINCLVQLQHYEYPIPCPPYVVAFVDGAGVIFIRTGAYSLFISSHPGSRRYKSSFPALGLFPV